MEKKTPRIIDFGKEQPIREISQILRACDIDFVEALLRRLTLRQKLRERPEEETPGLQPDAG